MRNRRARATGAPLRDHLRILWETVGLTDTSCTTYTTTYISQQPFYDPDLDHTHIPPKSAALISHATLHAARVGPPPNPPPEPCGRKNPPTPVVGGASDVLCSFGLAIFLPPPPPPPRHPQNCTMRARTTRLPVRARTPLRALTGHMTPAAPTTHTAPCRCLESI